MITEARICDTVCRLASAGKLLPKNLPNGQDPYDGMCHAFNVAFGGEPININDWEKAEKNYIKSKKLYISVGDMQQEIEDIQREQSGKNNFVPDFRNGLSDEVYWRRFRTSKRLIAFTKRMWDLGLKASISDYLPEKSAAVEVGLKHGLTKEDLSTPTEKGGQLLAIRCFMAEYYTCKKLGKPFPYIMTINNHEVEWVRQK